MAAPEELVPGVPLAYATEAEVIRLAERHTAHCRVCHNGDEPCSQADGWARAVAAVSAAADRVTERRVRDGEL